MPTAESKPLHPASIYAISKLDQELMCLAVGRAYDIGVVALRYFNTYGPRQALSNPYTGVAAIFSSRLINGQPPLVFEDGAQLRDFIHVHDVARATVLALESRGAVGEAINIGTGRPVSVLGVAEVLAQHIGVELPARLSATSRSGDIRHCWADATKARALLGFEPGGELRRRHARAGRVGARAGGRRPLRGRARRAARCAGWLGDAAAVTVLAVSITVAVLAAVFVVTQLLYLFALIHDLYMLARPVDWVELDEADGRTARPRPRIVLLYPVLREPEETMRTTFLGLATLDYPPDRYRIVAVPNHDDAETIAALERLQLDFPFLEVLEVPPTTDPSWEPVWESWEATEKAYWWHTGATAREPRPAAQEDAPARLRAVHPPRRGDRGRLAPELHRRRQRPAARPPARRARRGRPATTSSRARTSPATCSTRWAASWHAMDHMAWDGMRYAHMSAHGRHPYWVLGKGLFYHAPDLIALGSFNPWVTIEDPEVGMRLWVNGTPPRASSRAR